MAPSPDEVRRELDRLLASAVFANSGRMSRFLKFVVDKTLAGDGERIKEYVIGVEVFDRDAEYDPRVDSIVRVEAARLRSKLAEYYAGQGRSDAVVLSLPKGGYAPLIELHEPPAAAGGSATSAVDHARGERTALRSLWPRWALGAVLAGAVAVAVWAPSMAPAPTLRIAVLPFTPDPSDARTVEVATHLTEGVTAELVRTGRFPVVASSAARAAYATLQRPRDIAAALKADVLVEARVLTDGERVRVEARASDGRERKFWVDGFAGTNTDSDALERQIAAGIAAALSALKVD